MPEFIERFLSVNKYGCHFLIFRLSSANVCGYFGTVKYGSAHVSETAFFEYSSVSSLSLIRNVRSAILYIDDSKMTGLQQLILHLNLSGFVSIIICNIEWYVTTAILLGTIAYSVYYLLLKVFLCSINNLVGSRCLLYFGVSGLCFYFSLCCWGNWFLLLLMYLVLRVQLVIKVSTIWVCGG